MQQQRCAPVGERMERACCCCAGTLQPLPRLGHLQGCCGISPGVQTRRQGCRDTSCQRCSYSAEYLAGARSTCRALHWQLDGGGQPCAHPRLVDWHTGEWYHGRTMPCRCVSLQGGCDEDTEMCVVLPRLFQAPCILTLQGLLIPPAADHCTAACPFSWWMIGSDSLSHWPLQNAKRLS